MDALQTTNGTYSLSTNTVRLLTENVGDDMTSEDYYELYLKLRSEYPSLSKFAEAMGPYPTKGEWGRYDNRVAERASILAALRKAGNRLTTTEIFNEHVPAGTPLIFLGEGERAQAVLLVGDTTAGYKGPPGIKGYLNTHIDTDNAPSVESSPPARAQRAYWRPCLAPELGQRVKASGATVEELLEYALDMKQREV